MEQMERSLTKGQIQLVSVGVLLPYVLYAAPVLNLYLEDMIEQVHDMVKHIPEVRMSRYYQPMQWLPHISLGLNLSYEQMQEAFSVMLAFITGVFWPFSSVYSCHSTSM